LPKVYKAGVEMVTSHFVKTIEDGRVTLYNVHDEESELVLDADWLIMVTARTSENQLYALVKDQGLSVEMVGDATAPRGTYEAVYEGHRQARKV